jgi:hypothetical protein
VLSALHEQATIPVADPEAFGAVRGAIQTAFSSARVKDFLKSIERAGLRIRDFESILRKGLLGAPTASGHSFTSCTRITERICFESPAYTGQ